MKQLLMPQTTFDQRNSAAKEPETVEFWKEVFQERNSKNSGSFVLHDGPPYANGELHAGHLFNKVLKDMVVKHRLMSGYKVNFRPGFDCHGLPTELAVEKSKTNKPLREACAEHAAKYADSQSKTFQSFGVFAEWDNPYLTMDKNYEAKQLEVLYTLLNQGKLYLAERPVHYSPSSKTVLAESELEYKDRVDQSAYFTFTLEDGRKLLCWTTQPWTVFGNEAVCANPSLTYCDMEFAGEVYVLSKGVNLLEGKVLREYPGRELEGLRYKNLNKLCKVLCDEFVKEGNGTGLVHLAPAHGLDDFNVCKKYGVTGEDLTNDDGYLLGTSSFCLDEGSFYALSELKKNGMLFEVKEYKHSYPHDWRTNQPVYFRLTKQFFLDLKDIKKEALKALESVEFSEKRWQRRLVSMLHSRDVWCVSRQRKWGFPLAVFLKDGQPFLDQELNEHVLNLFKERGSQAWFEEDCLPDKFKNLGLVKCDYTLDVWLDSGVSWYAALDEEADVYFEGSDQHRGWFQSSLLTSVAMKGKAPYKTLLTHGFVLDGNGNKMSKSVGNVVDPKDVQKKYNTDVFRLWVASVKYSDDVRLGEDSLKGCAKTYFKLRNTMRYLLGNMYGYTKYGGEFSDKDKKALDMCDKMLNDTLTGYEVFDFRKSYDSLVKWTVDFSSFYLDNDTKHELYETGYSESRSRCQYVLKYGLERFIKALAPMCPFLAEDAYQNYELKKEKSVFLEQFDL